MFRQEESRASGFSRAKSYLVDNLRSTVQPEEKAKSLKKLEEIEAELGPVVDSYPYWHPLVNHYFNTHSPRMHPNEDTGYKGLDHTIYFRNGFITCPYVKPEDVVNSVAKLPHKTVATISAELIKGVHFYQKDAEPVVVKCVWNIRPLANKDFIDISTAAPLMIEQAIRDWHEARFSETWETMRPYILGQPHGATSSHFVDRQTGVVLKNLYLNMVKTGMYGGL
jgi:hypothetical protein